MENIGFEPKKKIELEKRRKEEQKRFPNQILSERLVDYGYILDLKKIIMSNWPEFAAIFQSREVTSLYLDQIGKFRNPIIHKRKGMLEHQKQLCLGICGEIMLQIERWKKWI